MWVIPAGGPSFDPTLTFEGSDTDVSSGTSSAFSVDIGTASTDRLLVFLFLWPLGRSFSSGDIAGADTITGFNDISRGSFGLAVTDLGGTQTINVAHDSTDSPHRAVIVWSITDYGLATARDTTSDNTNSGEDNILTCSVLANGIMIGGGLDIDGGTITQASSGFTEDVNAVVNGDTMYGYSWKNTGGSTSKTLTIETDSAGSNYSGASAFL